MIGVRLLPSRHLPLIVALMTVICVVTVADRAEARPTQKRSLTGVVNGDGVAQRGYQVDLYARYTTGTPQTKLLGTDTSDRAGRFEIAYRLPRGSRGRTAVLYVIAGKNKAMLASATGFEHHFSGLVASLSLYEAGKFDILEITAKAGTLARPGAAAELADAFRRGSQCTCDFETIDHLARADDSLDDVRAECGITPRAA